MTNREREGRVWLWSQPGIGRQRYRALVDAFPETEAIGQASLEEIISVVGAKIGNQLFQAIPSLASSRLLEHYANKGVGVVLAEDADYPARLNRLGDERPPVLFVRGDIGVFDTDLIGMVGTRKPTSYGLYMTEKLVEGLVGYGMGTVSGMALGIDGAVHQATLRANGKTVAILGSGFGKIYPGSHAALADSIASQGLLVTTRPWHDPPMKGHFIERNRYIAALSKGLVVVEAAVKSGTHQTVEHAASLGIPIFAVPGNADRAMSQGPLALIKEGATLTTEAADILNGLGEKKMTISRQVSEETVEWLELIEACEGDVDLILRTSGKTLETILEQVTLLEMDGLVERRGNEIWVRGS